MEKNKLNDKEIIYFYNLLVEYEQTSIFTGLQERPFLNAIEGIVTIDDHYDRYDRSVNITEATKNCFKFTQYGSNVCHGILHHVRNSFAHANLYSTDDDKSFLIQDFCDKKIRSKCNMLAYIDKQTFYKVIQSIKDTRRKRNN